LRRSLLAGGSLCYHRAEGGEDTKALGSRTGRSAVTGIAGGTFSGLTGVGGGAVMVPLLTGQLGLSQHRAHGTSLAIILFIAASGAAGYWRAGNIDWRLVATLAPGAVVGVYVGAKAMLRVPAPQLRALFGLFLLFVAFRQLVWHISAGTPHGEAVALVIELGFGFAGGVLAGVLGVGGGAIFVPAIVIFGLAHASAGDDAQKIAQGVSLAVIVCTGFFGTLTNLRQETIDTPVLLAVLLPAMAAAFLASQFANRLDSDVLRRVYGVVALGLGVQILYTTVRGRGRAMEISAI
jgi:uncharacterized membrane protein YfcA